MTKETSLYEFNKPSVIIIIIKKLYCIFNLIRLNITFKEALMDKSKIAD